MGTTIIDPGAAAAQAIADAAKRAAEAAAKAAMEAAKKAAEAAAKQAAVKTTTTGTGLFQQKDGFDAMPRRNPALLGTTQNNAGSTSRLFGGLEPSWLQNGQRPPFMSQSTWNSVGIQERVATLADCRSGWAQHLQEMAPDWLENGQRPPFISEETWNSVGIQERNAIMEDSRTAFRAAAQEDAQFFFNGVPEGGVRVDHPYQAMDPGMYGQGQVGEFSQYAVQQGSAAQYLNVNKIIPGEGYAATHYNLCGELAVGSMLGMSPSDAMSLYAQTDGNGLNPGEKGKGNTTGFGDLGDMIEEAGWTQEWVRGDANGPPYTPQQMNEMLESGQGMIALVNIDTKNADGMLRPVADDQKNVAHWVRVMDVTTNPNGETYVRVFNPFQNSEEVYSWEDFTASWSSTSGNSSRYGVIVATPPPES